MWGKMPTSSVSTRPRVAVYLLDTHVLSEIRKKQNANKGVREFFERVIAGNEGRRYHLPPPCASRLNGLRTIRFLVF